MSGADPVAARARAAPDAAAVVHRAGVWTYRELDRRVERAARRLRTACRGPGGCVGLVLTTRPEAIVLLHAAARAGCRVSPLSPRLTAPELRSALDALDPAVVVCEAGTLRRTADALDGGGGGGRAPRLVRLESGASEGDGVGVEPLDSIRVFDGPLAPLAPDRIRAVLWTSGTTGAPRGVLLTGANLEASARAAGRRLDLSPEDRWYAALSMAHVGGLALVTRAAFLGSAVVIRAGFDATEFVRGARAGSVSHVSLVPVMLRRVLDEAGSGAAAAGLRCVLLGGARTPEALLERALDAGFPVALTYGQTEASSQIATAPPPRVRRKPGSVGRPLPGLELRIAEEDEILVRGPTVAAGYLAAEDFPVDADGWLRTGDRGRLDADGDLWITGRLRERIVSGGVSVDPAEVEAALREMPGLAEAAVVGVADPEWGEAVAAALVAGSDPAPDAEAVRAHCRARLSGPKRPRRLRFLDALPRTVTGKVDRASLRGLLTPDTDPDDP